MILGGDHSIAIGSVSGVASFYHERGQQIGETGNTGNASQVLTVGPAGFSVGLFGAIARSLTRRPRRAGDE